VLPKTRQFVSSLIPLLNASGEVSSTNAFICTRPTKVDMSLPNSKYASFGITTIAPAKGSTGKRPLVSSWIKQKSQFQIMKDTLKAVQGLGNATVCGVNYK
jgi:hypothetical protein